MSDITLDCLKEYIVKKAGSLDPRWWHHAISIEAHKLRSALQSANRDRKEILKHSSQLMWYTVGFNLVAAGPEQLGLFHEEEHKELMTLLTECSQLHERAIDFLGDRDYIESFRRVHQEMMTDEPATFDDLATNLILPEPKGLIT